MHEGQPPDRFEQILSDVVLGARLPPRLRTPGECRTGDGTTCTLCLASRLTYEMELPLKERALGIFRSTHLGEVRCDPLLASARGRYYRIVTKRKVFPHPQGPLLGLIDPRETAHRGAFPVERCVIEPDEHRLLYAEVQRQLGADPRGALSRRLRYVVLKGSYDERMLILSVTPGDRSLTREANHLSQRLHNASPGLEGVFLMEDPSPGRYYLGPDAALSGGAGIRKIFGRPNTLIRVEGRAFLYPPGAFTQVNLAMADRLVEVARELLEPRGEETLYDLYSGYGLFALCLAGSVRRVIGAEWSPVAVEAARANARRQHAANTRFHRTDITPESVSALVRPTRHGDLLLLDPPRSGTSPGVIEAIAARGVSRVLHIVCNMDILPREIRRWTRARYRVKRLVPMDLFPGTASVEMLCLLEPRERLGF